MPIVRVSAEDLKKSVRIKEGWYRAKIKECKPEPTSDKKSINYNFYFIVDDHGIEREYKHSVNQAVLASFGPPIVCAALSTETEPYVVEKDSGNPWEFNTDDVAGKSLCIKFEPEPYQGNIINKPKVFLPAYYDFENTPF